jgi:tetratricopeptide (TPR) repeat protein
MFLVASILVGLGGGLILLVLTAFLFWRISKAGNVNDAIDWPSRVIITALLLGGVIWSFHNGKGGGKAEQFMALVAVLISAVPLCVLWIPSMVDFALTPLLGAMTGGNETVELRPFYARAVAYRKRGDYSAAIAEIEAQLQRFPADPEGMRMLAEVHSDDLKDVPTAMAVLTEMIVNPDAEPTVVAQAMSRQAELKLNRQGDVHGARELYQRIVAQFAGTEAAITASQRLAHLPDPAALAAREEPAAIPVVRHEERLGLTEDLGASQLVEQDPAALTREYVERIEASPDDWESREKLAQLYVNHWQRFDLATDLLEELIRRPGMAPRQVARWLNELADLQLKSPEGSGVARLTLERIGTLFPGSQWAQQAESRIQLLGLDRRAKAAPRTVRLGTYEANIGLKRGDPTIPDPSRHAV